MDFRSSAKNVTLNVNDEGGVVVLKVSDDGWVGRFSEYITRIEKKSKEHAEAAGEDSRKNIEETVKLALDCKEGFDDLFGEGAYQAVFDTNLVGVEYVLEFIEAVMPYIEERMNKRKEMVKKYDPNRTGGAG